SSSSPVAHDLVAFDAASRQERLITNLKDSGAGTSVWGHSISPDRKSLAFTAFFRPTQQDFDTGLATEQLWVVGMDGQGFRRLTPTTPNTGTSSTTCTIDATCLSGYFCASPPGLCRLRNFVVRLQDPSWAADA